MEERKRRNGKKRGKEERKEVERMKGRKENVGEVGDRRTEGRKGTKKKIMGNEMREVLSVEREKRKREEERERV